MLNKRIKYPRLSTYTGAYSGEGLGGQNPSNWDFLQFARVFKKKISPPPPSKNFWIRPCSYTVIPLPQTKHNLKNPKLFFLKGPQKMFFVFYLFFKFSYLILSYSSINVCHYKVVNHQKKPLN